MATLLLLVGNCNCAGHDSTTEVRASTLKTGESGLASVGAAENAAMERMAPSEADSDPPIRAEV